MISTQESEKGWPKLTFKVKIMYVGLRIPDNIYNI